MWSCSEVLTQILGCQSSQLSCWDQWQWPWLLVQLDHAETDPSDTQCCNRTRRNYQINTAHNLLNDTNLAEMLIRVTLHHRIWDFLSFPVQNCPSFLRLLDLDFLILLLHPFVLLLRNFVLSLKFTFSKLLFITGCHFSLLMHWLLVYRSNHDFALDLLVLYQLLPSAKGTSTIKVTA